MIRQVILSSVAACALLLGAQTAWAADATAADTLRVQPAGTTGEADDGNIDSGWQIPTPAAGGELGDSGWQ
ncbi:MULTISPECIES: hypothetical protein [unclassified Streptomyces]|uniref:hypothetical protein n=1 Tax=unclassified Streptomyces TaxID=2593676 RepID=UPI001CBC600D|nr:MULTISPECIES: hypothetical protein [unclassified Streptomyces]WPO69798.1 hypothetical protein R9806_03685 [Streptomyces sp. KN37]